MMETLSPATAGMDRRRALRTLARAGAAALLASLGAAAPTRAHGARRVRRAVKHPEPRPDASAAHVLPAEDVPEADRDAYAAARAIPEVLDGIYCHCDCAARKGFHSLLDCYSTRMPTSCGICTGEARLALQLHRDGKSLDEIRAAIDKRFGD